VRAFSARLSYVCRVVKRHHEDNVQIAPVVIASGALLVAVRPRPSRATKSSVSTKGQLTREPRPIRSGHNGAFIVPVLKRTVPQPSGATGLQLSIGRQ